MKPSHSYDKSHIRKFSACRKCGKEKNVTSRFYRIGHIHHVRSNLCDSCWFRKRITEGITEGKFMDTPMTLHEKVKKCYIK